MQMHTRSAALLCALVVTVTPARASAQGEDVSDIVAYVALSYTPLGAFAPLPPRASPGDRPSAFVLRYGNLDFGFTSLHNFALGGDIALERGRLGFTLGGTACDGCDGNIMAGMDYTRTLTENVLAVALRPAFGLAKPLEGDGVALSLGLSLPIALEFSGATGPSFIPFVSPGFGFGMLTGGGDSESGLRPMLGGGFSIVSSQSALGLHLGLHKVFIDGGRTTLGIGVSLGGRAR